MATEKGDEARHMKAYLMSNYKRWDVAERVGYWRWLHETRPEYVNAFVAAVGDDYLQGVIAWLKSGK